MTIHRPGLPEDLPPGEKLWARWALLAAVDATAEKEARPGGRRTGIWIDADGLHLDDCGCTWWTLSREGEHRFVLYGEDEASAVKWHDPSIDMLAGAPDWLPYQELGSRLAGHELGCVYWYEDGVWARAPYPDDLRDDGLDCGMYRFVDRDEVLGELFCRVDEEGDGPSADSLLSDAEEHLLLADRLLERLRPFDGRRPDLPAVSRALGLARITAPVA